MRAAVRILQVLLVSAIAVVAYRVHAGGSPGPYKTEFSLSVFGERGDPDGTNHAVDLLKHPDGPTDRYQVAIAPTQASRVTIDEINGTGTRRVYPATTGLGFLPGGRTYALPGNEAFFEHHGRTKLRIIVAPESEAPVAPAELFGSPGVESLRMDDGRPFVTSARLYRAPDGASVELTIQ
jgi:hypothetical protein